MRPRSAHVAEGGSCRDDDSATARPLELDALYRRRWRVEVDLRAIKAVMGVDILAAKPPVMVDKQIAAHLLDNNRVRALIARAAAGAHVLARSVGFKVALELLLAFQQQPRFAAGKRAKTRIAYLIGAVSCLRLPVRPDRFERAIKRRPKTHKMLTAPRPIARETLSVSRQVRA